MSLIDFPNSPAVDDLFTAGNSSYRWTGTAWVSNNLGEVEWDDVTGKPTSFTPSAHASSHGAGGADAITIAPSQISGTTISSKTGAYTLVAGDKDTLIQANGTFTITVPDATIPAGARVDIVNVGTGVITLAGEDLTISSKNGALTVATQYSGATLFFTSTTTALLIGDLA